MVHNERTCIGIVYGCFNNLYPLNKQRLEWFSVNYVAGEAISDYAERLNIKYVLVILKELMEIL